MIFTNRPPKAKQSRPVFVNFVPNYAGQGGDKCLRLMTDEGRLITIRFENPEEVRQLMSQAHILWSNINDERMP